MSDGLLFLRVAADRIGAPGPDRIAGKNAIPAHQCRHLVPNHPDRREDGRHSKANCTSSGFESHLMGGGFHMGNFGSQYWCLKVCKAGSVKVSKTYAPVSRTPW